MVLEQRYYFFYAGALILSIFEVANFNMSVMKRFVRFSFALLLSGLICLIGMTGCSGSEKTMCQRDNTYKKHANLNNRSKYSSRYNFKAKAARKDYVVKNKRSGRRY